jgi:hypothetical protein
LVGCSRSDKVNRASGDLVVDFGGDHNSAARFEKLVPAQALKGRFADAVRSTWMPSSATSASRPRAAPAAASALLPD